MTCNCSKTEKTSLWTPIPEFRQPTAIVAASGENIDCFMKRAGNPTAQQNAVSEKIPNLIANTSLTSTLTGVVNTTFTLTPASTAIITAWEIAVNGTSGLGPFTGFLTFDAVGGVLSGTVSANLANTNYSVLITAVGPGSVVIDSRAFTFYPKSNVPAGEVIKFVFPLPGGVVNVTYGPANSPTGSSFQHKGLDIAMADGSLEDVVSASDGVVSQVGPQPGYGNWIVINHNDSNGNLVATTVYGHMDELYVKVGQIVAGGQPIGHEGAVGVATPHLHFELHKGGFGNPVDPMPYLFPSDTNTNTTQVATNGVPGEFGVPASLTTVSVPAAETVGMTSGEASTPNPGCAGSTQGGQLPGPLPAQVPDGTTPPTTGGGVVNANRAACAATGPSYGNAAAVQAIIQNVCVSHGGLSDGDIQFIQTVAHIESNYDPYAKNPTSSATGLFQMLDKVGNVYYAAIGVPFTCENRCNPTYATQAMIVFYLAEFKPYWNNYVASSKTTIAGKTPVSNGWTAQYASFTQGEFMYGLIHHDGVGNAIAGIDKQGVAYYRSKV